MTSENATPPPNPVPSAFRTASFAAKRPARRSTPVGPVAYLVQLFLNKAALDQRIAWIVYPAPHLGDVDQIDPVSDDVHIPCLSPPRRLRVAVPRQCTSNDEVSKRAKTHGPRRASFKKEHML